MINQGVHRISVAPLMVGKGRADQCPAPGPARLGQGDHARVDRFFAEEGFGVPDIFGDDHLILGDAGVLDRVIELAAPSDMQRMNGVMAEFGKLAREGGRQAFVDEQAHVSGRGARNALLPAGKRMRLGEHQRRFQGFAREIGVFRSDLVERVAMGDARFRSHARSDACP